MASKTEAMKRRVTKRVTTIPSILKGVLILIAGVTLIIFQFADQYEEYYGVYKFVEAALISCCVVSISFLIIACLEPLPCVSSESLWLIEAFIHAVCVLVLALGAVMCYVRSYDKALLITTSISAAICAVIHLVLALYLYLKRKRIMVENEAQRQIDQKELEKRIHAAQHPTGRPPESQQPTGAYSVSANVPAIGGF